MNENLTKDADYFNLQHELAIAMDALVKCND